MAVGTKRHLASFERWSTMSKILSGAFLAVLAMSFIAAGFEYYTLQHVWMPPASFTFTVALVLSAVLTIVMQVELRRKEQAIDFLKLTTDSLKRTKESSKAKQ